MEFGTAPSPIALGQHLEIEGKVLAMTAVGGHTQVLTNVSLNRITNGLAAAQCSLVRSESAAAELHVMGNALITIRDGRAELFYGAELESQNSHELPSGLVSAVALRDHAWLVASGQLHMLDRYFSVQPAADSFQEDSIFGGESDLYAVRRGVGVMRWSGTDWSTKLAETTVSIAAAIPHGVVAAGQENQKVVVTRLREGLKRASNGPPGLPRAMATDGNYAAVLTSSGMIAVADLERGTWTNAVAVHMDGDVRVAGWVGKLNQELILWSVNRGMAIVKKFLPQTGQSEILLQIENCESIALALAGESVLCVTSTKDSSVIRAL